MNQEKAIELLRRVRPYLNDHSPMSVQTIYIPLAQAMRNAADAMEREEALIREVDEFLASQKIDK